MYIDNVEIYTALKSKSDLMTELVVCLFYLFDQRKSNLNT